MCTNWYAFGTFAYARILGNLEFESFYTKLSCRASAYTPDASKFLYSERQIIFPRIPACLVDCAWLGRRYFSILIHRRWVIQFLSPSLSLRACFFIPALLSVSCSFILLPFPFPPFWLRVALSFFPFSIPLSSFLHFFPSSVHSTLGCVTGDVWGPCQMDHRWEV